MTVTSQITNFDTDLTDLLKTKTIILDGSDPEEKRQEILDYFHRSFTLYEKLFECLRNDDAYYFKANNLRHPLIFYYGHTATFFINKLNISKKINKRIDQSIESSCAIGVDEMSWDDLDNKNYDWPTVDKVKEYRDKTRDVVDDFIRNCKITLPIQWNDPLWIVMMGIEHERIHLETSAVLIRELPIEMVKKHHIWQRCDKTNIAPSNELIPIRGKKVVLGKDKEKDNHIYGWDNEYGSQITDVEDFRASKYLVSNFEYLEFVNDKGYSTKSYWSDEGWEWLGFTKNTHPRFWIKDSSSYKYRSMIEEIDMPWDWPVDINQLEAKAFCNWKSTKTGKNIRMPTEAEYSVLRDLVGTDQPFWDNAPGNINLEYYASSCPVNEFEFKNGLFDIIGNVWQWTETTIDAFSGFEVHPVYDDFSTPTFDGKHNIFKGGCFISTGNYAIKDSRYAFRRHFYQNAGLRYIEGKEMQEQKPNIYESDNIVSQYIEFHYGEKYFDVDNFAKSCADICIEYMKDRNHSKALDIGCATGRASFELARVFEYVDALDFSARLIQTPVNMQKTGIQRYIIQTEGDLKDYKEVSLKNLGLDNVSSKVNFMQADACNLPDKFNYYDLVFAGNLIDRLYNPKSFLKQITNRINKGGLLIIASPYTWLEDFTDKDKWLGGFKSENGENYTSLDGLKENLLNNFNLIDTRNIPFVIRETSRKFQHTISEFSIWERK